MKREGCTRNRGKRWGFCEGEACFVCSVAWGSIRKILALWPYSLSFLDVPSWCRHKEIRPLGSLQGATAFPSVEFHPAIT